MQSYELDESKCILSCELRLKGSSVLISSSDGECSQNIYHIHDKQDNTFATTFLFMILSTL